MREKRERECETGLATVAISRSSFFLSFESVLLCEGTQSHGEGEGEDGAGGRDAVTSTDTTERDGLIIGKGDGGEKIARETPMERKTPMDGKSDEEQR